MSAVVSWTGDLRFEAVSDSGHGLTIDGRKETGASPMELLLLGAAGCSAIDVVTILQKMRQQVVDVRCAVDGTRADDEPKVYTRIHMQFTVAGQGLSEAKVAQAIRLSAEKYCSASIMLGKTAEITHGFEIVEAAPA